MRNALIHFVFGLILGVASCDVSANDDEFAIGVGDELAIAVYNEPDLSVNAKVGSSGLIKLPLVGDIRVIGKTAKEVGSELEAMFYDGYLVNPSVSVVVESIRPFYIRGWVNQPGAYAFSFGMTVEQAFAIAGGLSERASKNQWLILREGKSERIKANKDTLVMPGDVVEVGESFF
ncbi:polysaccharide biosynthesis/export family protein [Ningiella sp. W23]|uniref:polysaccharide biosynthesis/export family protein n=1 Tax=Ningiella sp. W23 TaxID=3023715 RepID=UPI003757687A